MLVEAVQSETRASIGGYIRRGIFQVEVLGYALVLNSERKLLVERFINVACLPPLHDEEYILVTIFIDSPDSVVITAIWTVPTPSEIFVHSVDVIDARFSAFLGELRWLCDWSKVDIPEPHRTIA